MKNMSDYDDGSLAFRLRQEFRSSEDFEDEQPSVEKVLSGEFKSPSALEGGGFRFGVFELVGHGKQTSERCGTFHKVIGCSRVELHNEAFFDEKSGKLISYRNKGFFRPVFHSCDKPSCPKCYERGHAVREAKNVVFRLEQASKRFGRAEHIIVGLPSKFWGLSYETLRKKCLDALRSRGVVGGALIFHGARYNNFEEARRKGMLVGWYWSPHFHVLGFILGGYGKCRGCFRRSGKPCRRGCGGFVDRNFRLNEVDGIYVKVKGKRESVFGTAWYQLHHATIRTDRKRAHVVTWFGVCSYRRLKIDKALRREYDELHRAKCPICGSDLVRHEYCGCESRFMEWFRKVRGARECVKGEFDFVGWWRENPERGSGSYAF